jgi:hypothetical protein
MVRDLVRFLARPPAGAPASGWRRAALVSLMPWLVRRHHVVELLALLDSEQESGGTPDARSVVDGLRRRRTTCLYRSLAGFAALRDAGADVRFVIGVRVEGGDVVAHAWIEERGEPVGEPQDPRDRFAVAFVHPPREGDPGVSRMADGLSSKDVILTEMKDGTGVLLDLKSKFYFTLNETGVAVWRLLASGEAATPRALAERIARDFDAPSVEVVEADVKALLEELTAEGLLAAKSAP